MARRKLDPTLISRRTLLGATSAAPLVGDCATSADQAAQDLISECARWLAADLETDRLSRRWAALEIQAVAEHSYFQLDFVQRRQLPMGPEMAAIETKLQRLSRATTQHWRRLSRAKPSTLHEVASLLAIAARQNLHADDNTEPLVRTCVAFLASTNCPRCGEPYVPASLSAA